MTQNTSIRNAKVSNLSAGPITAETCDVRTYALVGPAGQGLPFKVLSHQPLVFGRRNRRLDPERLPLEAHRSSN
jgi:hypothetical protein